MLVVVRRAIRLGVIAQPVGALASATTNSTSANDAIGIGPLAAMGAAAWQQGPRLETDQSVYAGSDSMYII